MALLPPLFFLAVLVASLITPTLCFCPHLCHCDNTALSANCSAAHLDSFPITLHPRLRQLQLRNNEITYISAGAVASYRRLRLLKLDNNRLQQLESASFAELSLLETLSLAGNQLQHLPIACLQGLHNLQELDLSNNMLRILPEDLLVSSGRLQRLLLAGNHLQSIPAFSRVGGLHTLDLTRNLFRRLPLEALSSLRGLRWLSVSFNSLSGRLVTSSVRWRLPEIEVLDLSGNDIQFDSRSFDGVASLRKLNLENVGLQRVSPLLLRHLPLLEQLDIGHNPFTRLSGDLLTPLPRLQVVSISFCPNLTHLAHNIFSSNIFLTSVYIHHNPRLTALDRRTFAHLNHLQHLDLRANSLKTLSSGAAKWHNLESLVLTGNAWRCDCQLDWLVALSARATLGDGGALCSAPVSLRGRHVHSLVDERLPCTSEAVTSIAIAAGVVSMLLLIVFITICACYRYRFRLRKMVQAAEWRQSVKNKRNETFVTHPRTYYYHDVYDVYDARDRRLVPVTEL